MDATKHFSTRDTARILQSTEARVRTLARLGGVTPEPGPGGRPEFTFQQLLLLRTTRGLLDAGIPARRVRRIWSSLRRQLADGLPLTSIRILADGDRAVAWDGNAPWQPDSGQFLLDFVAGDIAEAAETALRQAIRYDADNPGPYNTLAQLLRQKGDLEASRAVFAQGASAKQKKDAELGKMLQKK